MAWEHKVGGVGQFWKDSGRRTAWYPLGGGLLERTSKACRPKLFAAMRPHMLHVEPCTGPAGGIQQAAKVAGKIIGACTQVGQYRIWPEQTVLASHADHGGRVRVLGSCDIAAPLSDPLP